MHRSLIRLLTVLCAAAVAGPTAPVPAQAGEPAAAPLRPAGARPAPGLGPMQRLVCCKKGNVYRHLPQAQCKGPNGQPAPAARCRTPKPGLKKVCCKTRSGPHGFRKVLVSLCEPQGGQVVPDAKCAPPKPGLKKVCCKTRSGPRGFRKVLVSLCEPQGGRVVPDAKCLPPKPSKKMEKVCCRTANGNKTVTTAARCISTPGGQILEKASCGKSLLQEYMKLNIRDPDKDTETKDQLNDAKDKMK